MFLLITSGKFRDSRHGIDGACGPLFIHTDKSKTKVKEAEERERQRQGKAPSELNTKSRYTKIFDDGDSPEVLVASTHSGSMTQEIFYHFVNHFLAARPPGSPPAILLLDGHGSRWSVHALRKLIENNVYPFIIASHTSIWAQPNDAGVNKRYHWSIEQACKKYRRLGGQASVTYYNRILSAGWRIFIESERKDLRELGINNTTNAYGRTGAYPFNPFASAWTIAIDTLGLETRDNKSKVQYNVVLKSEIPVMTPDQLIILNDGIDMDPTLEALGYGAVACVRGEQILSKWRNRIEEAVSEGADYEEYASILLPSSAATTESDKLSLKLFDFELVDVTKLILPVPTTTEEKAQQLSERMVSTSHISDVINVS